VVEQFQANFPAMPPGPPPQAVTPAAPAASNLFGKSAKWPFDLLARKTPYKIYM